MKNERISMIIYILGYVGHFITILPGRPCSVLKHIFYEFNCLKSDVFVLDFMRQRE